MVIPESISDDALTALDVIENAELASLSWGYAHACLTFDELENLLEQEFGNDCPVDDLIEELLQARLIFAFADGAGDENFRSRFGEIVRLTVSNRQQFGWRDWQIAPQLVADYRIDRRKRIFPKRNVTLEEILALPSVTNDNFFQRALKELLGDERTQRSFALSGFQKRSLDKILCAEGETGIVVTAGTGSGKTLAFYLPALLEIAKLVERDNWVKAVAVYPRTELLKDQFMEAFKLARKLDDFQRRNGKRKIRIGAYYSSTPMNHKLVHKSWSRFGDGFLCPWLSCPVCENKVIWETRYQSAGIEKLTCVGGSCDFETDHDEIVLTRDAMQDFVDRKPDILFTTTETLNKRMADLWTRRIFGIGTDFERRPRFLLLDEVHTYEGVTGAQNALTLRRWKHAVGLSKKFCWVGLSATLENATEFFASISNLDVSKVVNEKPITDYEEFIEEGAEYQIVLRGDPTVRASLLSTAIQTCMIVPRLLDNPDEENSAQSMGLFGKKLFVFTDNLDVTNRLYDDLKDAEAYDFYGRPREGQMPLAALRSTQAVQGQVLLRDLYGQYWRSAEQLNYNLEDRINIGRTTSLDSGVTSNANVIVATAALEVGYNDPEVGATLQYKAPRGFASFLQRKGRAGRTRVMRPLSITILSDYGRDRLAFQNYEKLFDPFLKAQTLPINNSYVLKIQAVYALFDWLALELDENDVGGNLDLWKVLSGPYSGKSKEQSALKFLQKKLFQLIQCEDKTVSSFRNYLASALDLRSNVVEQLLWENPRSLMLEVIPTITRRWLKQWSLAFPSGKITHELQVNRHPVPEFIPQTLFSELSLPEVSIEIPAGDVRDNIQHASMPILQAMREFTPGNVSRRYADRRGGLSHWLPIDVNADSQNIEISQVSGALDFVGSFEPTINVGDVGDKLNVYRPWHFELTVVPRAISTSSKSTLNWCTDIQVKGDPFRVPVPQKSQWSDVLKGIDFYLHRQRGCACVRRFSSTATANSKVDRNERQIQINFVDENENLTALGFELEVDGIRFVVNRAEIERTKAVKFDPYTLTQLKHQYALEGFTQNPDLPIDLNVFQREWLFQVAATWVASEKYLGEFKIELFKENAYSGFRSSLSAIINSWFVDPAIAAELNAAVEGNANFEATTDEIDNRVTLQSVLIDKLENSDIAEALFDACAVLDSEEPDGFEEWITKISSDTLGQVVLQACVSVLPNHAVSEDLILDIDFSQDQEIVYWVTETTIGGAGVIENLAQTIAEFPMRFFEGLDAAITASEMELVDDTVTEVLNLSDENDDIAKLMNELRGCNNLTMRNAIWQNFTKKFSAMTGKYLGKAAAISLNSRLLRPGANKQLDALYLKLLNLRTSVEEASGFIIPNREFAYIASQNQDVRDGVLRYLGNIMGRDQASMVSMIAAIEGLLWTRNFEVRRTELQSYNPYREATFVDPIVIRKMLNETRSIEIPFCVDAMRMDVPEQLRERGIARVIFNADQTKIFQKELAKFLASPIDIGIFQFFPSVDYVERVRDHFCAVIVMKEQIS